MYCILRGCDVSAIHAKEPISKSVSPNPIKSQNGSYLMVRGDTRDDTSQPCPHICNILAIKCPPQHFIKKFPTNSPSIPFKSSNSLHFTHGQINILSMGPHFINILSYAQLASSQNGWCGEYAGKMLILHIGHLASDLTLSLILGGENVGNM